MARKFGCLRNQDYKYPSPSIVGEASHLSSRRTKTNWTNLNVPSFSSTQKRHRNSLMKHMQSVASASLKSSIHTAYVCVWVENRIVAEGWLKSQRIRGYGQHYLKGWNWQQVPFRLVMLSQTSDMPLIWSGLIGVRYKRHISPSYSSYFCIMLFNML